MTDVKLPTANKFKDQPNNIFFLEMKSWDNTSTASETHFRRSKLCLSSLKSMYYITSNIKILKKYAVEIYGYKLCWLDWYWSNIVQPTRYVIMMLAFWKFQIQMFALQHQFYWKKNFKDKKLVYFYRVTNSISQFHLENIYQCKQQH